MNTRRKFILIALGAVLAGFIVVGYGCKKSGSTAKAAETVPLCVKCGQIKGTDVCCKADQTTCSICSLAKGSPGCCRIPKGATEAALCRKCGQIKGDVLCCKAGQATCDKCGLVKGSPGCCKIPAL